MEKLIVKGKLIRNLVESESMNAEIELERLADDTPVTNGVILLRAFKRDYICDGSFRHKETDLGTFAIASPIPEKKEEVKSCDTCYKKGSTACSERVCRKHQNFTWEEDYKLYQTAQEPKEQESKEPDILLRDKLKELRCKYSYYDEGFVDRRDFSNILDLLIAHFSKEVKENGK